MLDFCAEFNPFIGARGTLNMYNARKKRENSLANFPCRRAFTTTTAVVVAAEAARPALPYVYFMMCANWMLFTTRLSVNSLRGCFHRPQNVHTKKNAFDSARNIWHGTESDVWKNKLKHVVIVMDFLEFLCKLKFQRKITKSLQKLNEKLVNFVFSSIISLFLEKNLSWNTVKKVKMQKIFQKLSYS